MDRRAISQFNGVKLDAARAKLPAGFFQADEGGDRHDQGMWKRRRGMRRTSIAKQTSAVTSIIGFELAGTGFGVVLAEGTNLHGFTGVTQLVDSTPNSGGFGVGGFGVGGFGA